MHVELRAASKSHRRGALALDSIDLDLLDGELLTLVGPSGAGKSTLLRLIAGLDDWQAGTLTFDGKPVEFLPAWKRNLGLVPQEPALLPHLSARDNIRFGLGPGRHRDAESNRRIDELASLLGISPLLDRRPSTLSGGEQQRVSLARALVRRPGLVLLDEPFSRLDAPLRLALREELKALQQRLGTTMLLVTHDQAEALALGHRVAILNQGRLEQVDRPQTVYDRPATRFVATFLGSPPMNLLRVSLGVVPAGYRIEGLVADTAWTLPPSDPATLPLHGRAPGPIDLGLRPESLALADTSTAPGPTLVGSVLSVEPQGHESWATVRLSPAAILRLRLPPSSTPAPGDRLPLRLDLARAHWFDPESGRRLGT